MWRTGKIFSAGFVIAVIALFSSIAYAAPSIQIHSPQNITYSAYGPIQINATSTERVDFSVKLKNGKLIEADSGFSFLSNLYGTRGLHNFTVYANNSNGTTSATVFFTINHSSVINVTSCGILFDDNTTYVLQNNVSSTGSTCIILGSGSTFDMNGYTIGTDTLGMNAQCANTDIFNGGIVSTDSGMVISGSKCRTRNLTIEAQSTGVTANTLSFSLLENITMRNVTVGVVFEDSESIIIKNLSLTAGGSGTAAVAFTNFDSVMTIENSKFSGFATDFRFDDVNNMDFYLKNNQINLSSVDDGASIGGIVRMFKLHLLKISVTDAVGLGKAAAVEMVDNGVLPRTNSEENLYTLLSNPTGRLIEGTDANGSLETFVTERLITYKVSSPLTTEEFVFGPYNVTARSGNTFEQNITVNTNVNSTIILNFTDPNTGTLPQCAIDQMLDLDNNGAVNINDARIILRRIVGLPVTVNSTKGCNGINFFPV